ncbi:MAG: ribonuclease P protein component [Variibacter sp.]
MRRHADFQAAARGKRAFSAGFVLQARRRDDDGAPRVGFTVSRKVGNAVERNRARRRLREAVKRIGERDMQPGHDYILVARREVLMRPFDALIADVAGTLRRIESGKAQSTRRRIGTPEGSSRTDTAAGDESKARDESKLGDESKR